MNNITFMKPIVLLKSLDDMTDKQRDQAISLLSNSDVITVGETGMKIIPVSEAKDLPIFFYGSEAVCMYRQMLGLPDVGIRTIDVNKIVESTCCFECLKDFIYFLERVEMRSDRFTRLSVLNAPPVILMNEYRVLHDYVEYLQDNNWSGHPKINSYDVKDEVGNSEHYDIVRKSLSFIGYDLITNTCDTGEDEEEEDQ